MFKTRLNSFAFAACLFVGFVGFVGFVSPAWSGERDAVNDPVQFNRDVRPILTRHCTSCHGGVKAISDVSFVNGASVLPPDGWVVEPGDAEASMLIERIVSDDPDMRMPPPHEHPDPVPPAEVEMLRRWINEGAVWEPLWSFGPLGENSREIVPDGVAAIEDNAIRDNAIRGTGNQGTGNQGTGSQDTGNQDTGNQDNGNQDKETQWGRQPLDSFVASQHRQLDLRPSREAPPEQWLRRATFDLIGLPPTPQQSRRFTQRIRRCGDDAVAREAVYASTVDELLASVSFGERWAAVWMDLARYADSMGYEKDPNRDAWPYRDWLVDAFNDDMPYDEFTAAQLAGDLLYRNHPDQISADVLIATAFHRNTMTNTEGGTDDEEFRVAAVIDRVNTTWTVWQGFTFGCVQCHAHPYDAVDHREYYAAMALFNDTLDCDLPSDYPTLRVPENRDRDEAIAMQLDRLDRLKHRNDDGVAIANDVAWQSLAPEKAASSEGSLKIVGDEIRTDGGTFPVGVQYTLDFSVNESSITAIRLHFIPTSDDPADWPEQGSVISSLDIQIIDGNGVKRSGHVPTAVFADKLTESDDPMEALQNGPSGVGPYPKIHGPRWAVFAFDAPIALNHDDRIRLKIRQSQQTSQSLSNPLRRLRCESTSDDRWSGLLNSESFRAEVDSLAKLADAIKSIDGGSLPIMQSFSQSEFRQTRQFIRGNWLEKDDVVSPGVPRLFSASGEPPQVNDRLELARWLVSDDNPLTARVWANRIWEQLFGLGLVETLEDFGSSGVMPTNVDLLDHLASRLKIEHQWRLKPMLREIVLSATYRQDHSADPSQYESDRFNRWLTRGPRTRLTAEMIRDQALAVSGLLSDKVGGPPVKPMQPDGVWQTIYNGDQWSTSKGQQRYRRAIYTYWKRTSPYPSSLTFDVPTRENCSARRIATNTPLQALVTLNDPVFVECGRELAMRSIEQHVATQTDHDVVVGLILTSMAETITGSATSDHDAGVLKSLYDSIRDDVATDIVDADAMAIIGNLLLNWDRALTK